MSERTGTSIALAISGLALAISVGSLMWAYYLGRADVSLQVLRVCSEYRSEVVRLHDRGLTDQAIERLLSMNVIDNLSTSESADRTLRKACGPVSAITQVLPPGE